MLLDTAGGLDNIGIIYASTDLPNTFSTQDKPQ